MQNFGLDFPLQAADAQGGLLGPNTPTPDATLGGPAPPQVAPARELNVSLAGLNCGQGPARNNRWCGQHYPAARWRWSASADQPGIVWRAAGCGT